MTRGARSFGGGFLSSRGFGGGVGSLVFRVADHHPAAIDLFADELRQLVRDITRGDRAVEATAFAGAGGELQTLAGDLVRQRLLLGFLLGNLAGSHRAIVL